MVTEVMDPRLVDRVCQLADVLQVGSRNMQNGPRSSARRLESRLMGRVERFIDPYDPRDAARQELGDVSADVDAGATLDSVRQRITEVDRQILTLLAQRGRLARRTRTFKGETPEALYDPAREAAVVRQAAECGATLGLDAEQVRDLYWHIVAMGRRAQVDEP